MDDQKTGVSIIICCYNSAQRLPETLMHIAAQKIRSHFLWEVIVVDNASTDDTSKVAKESWRKFRTSAPLKVVDQPISGLIHARNRGLEEAQYEYCLFCDDDNHLQTTYIAIAYNIMSCHPEVAILGGWSKPKLPYFPGKWIESCYTALAICKEKKEDGYVDWVFGAGMMIRKQFLSDLKERGIQILLSGRMGGKQTSGEDAEICLNAQHLGYKVFYSSELVLYHAVSKHRLTKRSFIRANCRNVYPAIYLHVFHELVKTKGLMEERVFFELLQKAFRQALFFAPRSIIGKYQFYSFIQLFQNLQILLWLLAKRKTFKQTFMKIKNNLYYACQ